MPVPGRRRRRPSRFVLGALVAPVALLGSTVAPAAAREPAAATEPGDGGGPAAITTFSTGYQTPWDITFMPDGRSALVTQRLDYQVFRLGPDGRKKRVG